MRPRSALNNCKTHHHQALQKYTAGSAQKLAPMLMGELFRLAKSPDGSVTQYSARAHRIHSGLSDAVVNDQQMVAMAVLRGLPEEFNVVAHSLQQTLSTLEQKDQLNEVGRRLSVLEQELKIKYGAQLPAAHQAAAAFGGARSAAQRHSSNSASSSSRSKDECYICGKPEHRYFDCPEHPHPEVAARKKQELQNRSKRSSKPSHGRPDKQKNGRKGSALFTAARSSALVAAISGGQLSKSKVMGWDLACTHNMTGDQSLLEEYSPLPTPVRIVTAGSEELEAVGAGIVAVMAPQLCKEMRGLLLACFTFLS